MDALLSDINQAGLGRSLQFELFRPDSVSVQEYYAEQPIALRVSGGYHDIAPFAADIAALSRIVTLNNLAIVPATGKNSQPGLLTMDATAKTFRYLDPDEVLAQKTARKAEQQKGGRNEALAFPQSAWRPRRCCRCWQPAGTRRRKKCSSG